MKSGLGLALEDPRDGQYIQDMHRMLQDTVETLQKIDYNAKIAANNNTKQ